MYFFNIDGLHIPECYLVKIEEFFFVSMSCFVSPKKKKKKKKTQIKHLKLQNSDFL